MIVPLILPPGPNPTISAISPHLCCPMRNLLAAAHTEATGARGIAQSYTIEMCFTIDLWQQYSLHWHKPHRCKQGYRLVRKKNKTPYKIWHLQSKSFAILKTYITFPILKINMLFKNL